MDSKAYDKHLEEASVKYGLLCRRCGQCCGAGNDPCKHLASDGNGRYKCLIYEDRLGPQETVSGKIFNCVPIKDSIRAGFSYPDCAYHFT